MKRGGGRSSRITDVFGARREETLELRLLGLRFYWETVSRSCGGGWEWRLARQLLDVLKMIVEIVLACYFYVLVRIQ